MEKMFSVHEAAQILGLCLDSVRRHLRSGKLSGIRVGRKWRITESQLASYLGLDARKLVLPSEVAGAPGECAESVDPASPESSSSPCGSEAWAGVKDISDTNEVIGLLLRTSTGRTRLAALVRFAAERQHLRLESTQRILHELDLLLQQRDSGKLA